MLLMDTCALYPQPHDQVNTRSLHLWSQFVCASVLPFRACLKFLSCSYLFVNSIDKHGCKGDPMEPDPA